MVNQKIKMVVEQVGFTTHPLTDVIKNNHFGGYMDSSQFEKFAEIIIKECINIIDDAVIHRIPASEYTSMIREYFDIKK